MTWLTKPLALEIIKTMITGLVTIHDTIRDWPEETTADETPAPAPAPAPTMPEIQTALRTIAQAEGTDWIQNELFPGLGITNITTLPNEKLAVAWELITTRLDAVEVTQP